MRPIKVPHLRHPAPFIVGMAQIVGQIRHQQDEGFLVECALRRCSDME
jgi:hypothetical protein